MAPYAWRNIPDIGLARASPQMTLWTNSARLGMKRLLANELVNSEPLSHCQLGEGVVLEIDEPPTIPMQRAITQVSQPIQQNEGKVGTTTLQRLGVTHGYIERTSRCSPWYDI